MRQGYTLVELLVVIGIIGLLTAILLPVLQAARSRSQSAACLSNLSQIGKAVSLYAADYDDHIPYAPDSCTKEEAVQEGQNPFNDPTLDHLVRILPPVPELLKPYMTDLLLWRCPLDNIDPGLRAERHYPPTWYELCGSSYNYDDAHALAGQTLVGYAKPAQSPLVYDHGRNHGGGPGGRGISQVVFADMHTKAINDQVLAEYIVAYHGE